MKKDLMVSICCLTYNHVNFISQCLEGFINQQTNFDYEILIHDDASTDGTQEVIKKYVEQYPDLIFPIYQKENQWTLGKKPTWEFNFNRSKGKYIALCEGDDYWTDALKLQKQVNFLNENLNFTFCSTNVNVLVQNTGEITSTDADELIKNANIYPTDLNSFLAPYIWYTSTIVFRKSIVESHIKEINILKNFKDVFLLSILLKHGKGVFFNEYTGVYRVHEEGVWSMISDYHKIKNNNQTFKSMAYYHHGKIKLINESYLYGLIDLYNYNETSRYNRFQIVVNFLVFCIYSRSYFKLFQREILKIN